MSADEAGGGAIHWTWVTILTDPVRLAVLYGLCEMGTATAIELARRCHTSDRTARRHLESLGALGLVREEPGERDGLTPGRPASRFTLDAEAATRLSALFELLREPVAPTPAPVSQPLGGR